MENDGVGGFGCPTSFFNQIFDLYTFPKDGCFPAFDTIERDQPLVRRHGQNIFIGKFDRRFDQAIYPEFIGVHIHGLHPLDGIVAWTDGRIQPHPLIVTDFIRPVSPQRGLGNDIDGCDCWCDRGD